MKRNSVFVCIAVGALLMSCQTAPRVSTDLTALCFTTRTQTKPSLPASAWLARTTILVLPCSRWSYWLDHGVGSTDHFRSLQHFCTTPKEMPVSLANWRIPAPIILAGISISLRLTLSRLCTIKGFSCDQWNRPLITQVEQDYLTER